MSQPDKNFLITSKDISNAKIICCTHLAGVKLNKLRRTPKLLGSYCVEIPGEFQLLHKSVTLVADVLFVNGIPFFITLSRKLSFVTIKNM